VDLCSKAPILGATASKTEKVVEKHKVEGKAEVTVFKYSVVIIHQERGNILMIMWNGKCNKEHSSKVGRE